MLSLGVNLISAIIAFCSTVVKCFLRVKGVMSGGIAEPSRVILMPSPILGVMHDCWWRCWLVWRVWRPSWKQPWPRFAERLPVVVGGWPGALGGRLELLEEGGWGFIFDSYCIARV